MLLITHLTAFFSARSFVCAPLARYRTRPAARTAVLLCLLGLGLVIGLPAHAHEIRPAYLKLTQLSADDAASMSADEELTDSNKCAIHTTFSSNNNWSYDWESYCSD